MYWINLRRKRSFYVKGIRKYIRLAKYYRDHLTAKMEAEQLFNKLNRDEKI